MAASRSVLLAFGVTAVTKGQLELGTRYFIRTLQ